MSLNATKRHQVLVNCRALGLLRGFVAQYSRRNGDKLENSTEIPIHTPYLDITGIGAIRFAKYTFATPALCSEESDIPHFECPPMYPPNRISEFDHHMIRCGSDQSVAFIDNLTPTPNSYSH
jgi:hypothetical protein